MKKFLFLTLIGIMLIGVNLYATMTIRVTQEENNVVASYSGTIDSFSGAVSTTTIDNALYSKGLFSLGDSSKDIKSAGLTPVSGDWTSILTSPTTRNGDDFAFNHGAIYAPSGYMQGNPISGSLTFESTTLENMGLTFGDSGSFEGNGNTVNFIIKPLNTATTFTELTEIITTDKSDPATPFAGLTLTDADSTAFTATLSLDDANKGTLSATTIAEGNLATVQAAIQAITFIPAENRKAVGETETTTITLIVTADGVNGTTTNTVVSTSVNDAPVITSNAITTSVKDTLYSYALNASDVDTDTNLIWSVTAGTTLPEWLSLSSGAIVTTLAGSGSPDSVDGTGISASFKYPKGMAVDSSGNIYVTDYSSHKIRKITPAGVVTTLAGSGSVGSADSTGISASFKTPFGIAVDSSGNVYVADSGNHKIRKITPAGVVTTLAGSGFAGSTDSTGTSASFDFPSGVTVDSNGNVYVADSANHKIRKITPAGVVTTLAGSGSVGSADGTGISASFKTPKGVALDSSGNVYVADTDNNKIRKITPAGVVTTLAGSGISGSNDDTGTSASFKNPSGVTLDSSGNVYVADTFSSKIRKITPAGVVTTLAGSGDYKSTDGTGTSASFKYPQGIAVDSSGNFYVADTYAHKIRKISLTPTLTGTPTDTNGAKASQDVNLTLSDGEHNVSHNFQITIVSLQTLTPTIAKGTTDTATSFTLTASSGNSLKYMFAYSSVTIPNYGDDKPLGAITYGSGTDITNAQSGQYLAIYEVDSNGKIVGFYQKILESSDILKTITTPQLTTTIPDQLIDVNNTALFDFNLTSYFTNVKRYSFEEVKADNNITDWLSINSTTGKFSVNTDNNSSLLGKYFIKTIGDGDSDTNATGYFTLRVKDLNASLSTYITSTGITGAVSGSGTKDGKRYSETNATVSGQNIFVKVYDDGSSTHNIQGVSSATSYLPDSQVKMETNGDVNTTTSTINETGAQITIEILGKANDAGGIKAEHSLTLEDGNITKAISKVANTITTIRTNRVVETNATVNSNLVSVQAQPSGKAQHTMKVGTKESKVSVDIAGAKTIIDSSSVTTSLDTKIVRNSNRYEAVAITDSNGLTITKFREIDGSDTEFNPAPTLANGESFPVGSDSNITQDGSGIIHIQTTTTALDNAINFIIE
jgi:hypothetical protein